MLVGRPGSPVYVAEPVGASGTALRSGGRRPAPSGASIRALAWGNGGWFADHSHQVQSLTQVILATYRPAVRTGTKVNAREAKRLATRERLFEAAVAEFKRTGMIDADVGAIVAEAGVAHGTFFFHFPTKEHVVAELGQREETRMAAELVRYLAQPRELADFLVEVTRRSVALERRLGTVLFKDMLGLFFSPGRVALDLWTTHPVINLVIAEFERVHRERELDDDVDPDNRGLFFLLGLYGLLITHDRNASRAGVLEQFMTTVLRGLGV